MVTFNELTQQEGSNGIQSGDLLVVKGDESWLTKIIRKFSGSEYTHTAMLVKEGDSWFVLETRLTKEHNFTMMPAEWWFERNPDQKTFIGKMPEEMRAKSNEEKIKQAALDPKACTRPYEMLWLAVVYFMQEWLGIFRPSVRTGVRKKRDPMICSTFIQEAWEKAGVMEKSNYKTPGDIVDVCGGGSSLIEFDYSTAQARRQATSKETASNVVYLNDYRSAEVETAALSAA